MTVAAFATGTQSATGPSETFLSSPNSIGTYTLHVDTNDMVAGDVLELRVYQMVLSGGTARVVYYGRFDGAQPTDDKIKVSDPIGNDLAESNALRFSLKLTFGTADFPWKVLRFS